MISIERHYRTEVTIDDLRRHRDDLHGLLFALEHKGDASAATQAVFDLYADAVRYIDAAIRKLQCLTTQADLETALELSIVAAQERKRCTEVGSETKTDHPGKVIRFQGTQNTIRQNGA